MQELNGFELAAKIQETAPDILIIFVSAYESYVYKSFEFRPFRFIPKQQMESMITQALEAAFRKLYHGFQRFILQKPTGHRKNTI